MNKIMNGKYYLISEYFDKTIDLIPINQKIYLGTSYDNLQYRVDIAAIDIITLNFTSEIKFKDFLYSEKYIKSPNTDLYIIRKNKYNNKEYFNHYEPIYNDFKRNILIKDLAQKRIHDIPINIEDVDDLLNKFISKLNSDDVFFEFMTFTSSGLDEYLKNKLIRNKIQNNLNYNIKYTLEDKITSYHVIRNIIVMWNTYENLLNKYSKKIDSRELICYLKRDYGNLISFKGEKQKLENILMNKLDKNNIDGQISMLDYQNTHEKTYDELMQDMVNEAKILKESSIEDERVRRIYEKEGLVGIYEICGPVYLNNLSLEDKYRIGLFDYVEYKRKKREIKVKRKCHK